MVGLMLYSGLGVCFVVVVFFVVWIRGFWKFLFCGKHVLGLELLRVCALVLYLEI